MPLYEYQCADCQALQSAFRPVDERNADLACEQCGGRAERVPSHVAVRLSAMSKVEKADPKYDKMVDRAMRNTRSADPDQYLRRMKPFPKDRS